ncbi:hypothetical protein [Pseudoalteromonas sp. C12FD-1]|uniref:hypothetical protein n=1 Tax=Pseudoalteromonas sp. C12FD-1 TaxID=3131979 RepID=UPI00307D47FE
MDFNLIVFLLLVLPLCFTWVYIKFHGSLFNLGVFFNAYSILYFFVGLNLYKYNILGGYVTSDLVKVAWLSLVGIVSFNVFYSAFSLVFKSKTENHDSYKNIPSFNSILLLFSLGVLAQLFIIAKVGPFNFFFIDRLDRFPIMKQYQHIVFIAKVSNIALIFALARYFYVQEWRDKALARVILAYNLFFAIMLISRSELAFTFIALFYFLEKTGKVRTKTIIIIGICMALLMFSYKGILYIYILGDQDYGTFNPGEFINWIRNTLLLFDSKITPESLPNNSYLLALEGVLNPSPSGVPLSEWFIQYFYPNKVVSGLTYGFSGVVEGYLYLKEFGVMIHFLIIAFIFSIIERKQSILSTALTICALFIMFRLFRSEIYNFTRTFIWYYFYQIIVFYFADKVLKKV